MSSKATKTMQFLRSIVVGPMIVATVVGCSPVGDKASADTTLRRGLQGSPESLDPHKFTSTQAGDILRDIGEGLMSYGAAGNLEGGVADRWEISDDGLTYVFYLRPKARWSNGEPVLAEHFLFSFRRFVSSETASPLAQHLAPVLNANDILAGDLDAIALGVSAIDSRTLSIKLRSATPYFLHLLTHPSTFPIYPPSVDDHGNEFARVGKIVTNGAYYARNRDLGSLIVLKRNEYYWDNTNAWFDKIEYHISESAQEVTRYRAGELDVTNSVDTSMFEKMQSEAPDDLRVSPFLAVYYYGFNLSKAPFQDNLRLREALSLAIDRETIVTSVTRRGEKVAYGWVPPGIDNYEQQSIPGAALSKKVREDRARRLFAEAGYGPNSPLEIEIRYNTLGGHQLIALAIQAMWRDVLGVEANLVNEEFKVFISNVMAKENTSVFRSSWTADYSDAYTFLQLMETDNPSNLTGYSNSAVDKLLNDAATTTHIEARVALLQEAERLALADHPIIPLYFYVTKHLVRQDIVGWIPNALDFHYSKHLSRVPD